MLDLSKILSLEDEQGRWNVFTSTGISRKSFAGVMDWQGSWTNGGWGPVGGSFSGHHMFVLVAISCHFSRMISSGGWAITLGDKFSDGTGERGPGQYDDKFDAAPDIDHGNKKVRRNSFLRNIFFFQNIETNIPDNIF